MGTHHLLAAGPPPPSPPRPSTIISTSFPLNTLWKERASECLSSTREKDQARQGEGGPASARAAWTGKSWPTLGTYVKRRSEDGCCSLKGLVLPA